MDTVSMLNKMSFYCQPILPLVYDESMSYYETLCKVVGQLNTTGDAVNKLNEGLTSEIADRQKGDILLDERLRVLEKTNKKIHFLAFAGTPPHSAGLIGTAPTRSELRQWVNNNELIITLLQTTDGERNVVYAASCTYNAGNWTDETSDDFNILVPIHTSYDADKDHAISQKIAKITIPPASESSLDGDWGLQFIEINTPSTSADGVVNFAANIFQDGHMECNLTPFEFMNLYAPTWANRNLCVAVNAKLFYDGYTRTSSIATLNSSNHIIRIAFERDHGVFENNGVRQLNKEIDYIVGDVSHNTWTHETIDSKTLDFSRYEGFQFTRGADNVITANDESTPNAVYAQYHSDTSGKIYQNLPVRLVDTVDNAEYWNGTFDIKDDRHMTFTFVTSNYVTASGKMLVRVIELSADANTTTWKYAEKEFELPFAIDTAMSDTSTNPVQNKVIKKYVDDHSASPVDTAMSDTSTNAVQNKVIKKYVDDHGAANAVLYTAQELTFEQKQQARKNIGAAASVMPTITGCVSLCPANVTDSNTAVHTTTTTAAGDDFTLTLDGGPENALVRVKGIRTPSDTDNDAAANVEYVKDAIPTALKNPEALTIKLGGATTTYDGSSAQEVNLPEIVVAESVTSPAYTNQIPLSVDAGGAIYNGVGYKSGVLLNTSGAEISGSGVAVSGYIPVKKGDIIRIKDTSMANVDTTLILTLTAAKAGTANCGKTISNIQGNAMYGTITINGNVATWDTSGIGYYFWNDFAWLRVTTHSADAIVTVNEEIADTVTTQNVLKSNVKVKKANVDFDIASPLLSGKTVVCFGDSIFGMTRDTTSVPAWAAAFSGAKVYNVGFGGCRMAVHPTIGYAAFSMWALADAVATGNYTMQDEQAPNGQNYFASQLAVLKSIDFATVDAIVIHYGTNDFAASVPLDDSNNILSTDTVCGALRYSIKKLLTAFPKIKIFVSLPIYRTWDGVGAETYKNSLEKTLPEYDTAMKTAAEDYNLPTIDGYKRLAINSINSSAYLSDGTHLNNYGRKQFGEFIGGNLICGA